MTYHTIYERVGIQNRDQDHQFLRNMEEARAKGKFRRLVALDKVGWNTPIYKITRHPRFNVDED